jgi:NAD(P)-dependent dehydrogenase (short-subunit alcohol dehydrogenase family)
MAKVTLFGSGNKGGATFAPAKDIPSLAGKVILITGAAGDLGRQTAIELAKYGRPARIYVADLPRGEAEKKAVVDRITREAYETNGEEKSTGTPRTEVRFIDLDLTSFESVRACASEFAAQEERLDILFLNAGIIRVAKGTTKEGYEVHFGLNYLGHALLAKLLIPTLEKTAAQGAEPRMVVVSSEGHAMAPKGGIQFAKLQSECAAMVFDPLPPYPSLHKALQHAYPALGLLPTLRPKQTRPHPPRPRPLYAPPHPQNRRRASRQNPHRHGRLSEERKLPRQDNCTHRTLLLRTRSRRDYQPSVGSDQPGCSQRCVLRACRCFGEGVCVGEGRGAGNEVVGVDGGADWGCEGVGVEGREASARWGLPVPFHPVESCPSCIPTCFRSFFISRGGCVFFPVNCRYHTST